MNEVKDILDRIDSMEKEVQQHQLENLNRCREVLENEPTKEEIRNIRDMLDRIMQYEFDNTLAGKIKRWKATL